MTIAEVTLWDRRIAAVEWNEKEGKASFQYDPSFLKSGIEVSPIVMPLSKNIYRFPELNFKTFKGLPGLLAESLPDKFGNALINTWLASHGRRPETFNPVERLCYTGTRGMGALEYHPTANVGGGRSEKIDIGNLVALASEILTKRGRLEDNLDENHEEALANIIKVGTSAGGARAKAVLAYNEQTGELRSGEANIKEGFSHWLLKFDGVADNGDKELADPKGYGRIEYAYYLMAKEAGINMTECRLFKEGGRAHFMTKRYDRPKGAEKLHTQSLGSLAHLDFNMANTHSYEQAFMVMRQLKLSMEEKEQQLTRTIFNVLARNQDDHVKNISYLMNKQGQWSLSPAYDMIFSFNPVGQWINLHQMSINGKREEITETDFRSLANYAGIKPTFVDRTLNSVEIAVANWMEHAAAAGVPEDVAAAIGDQHLLHSSVPVPG